MDRDDLKSAVDAAIESKGGEATIVEVAAYIWETYETELRASKDLFFTWQYEMRWAAQRLRDEHKLILAKRENKNVWRKV